jgi:hypothetical protein
MEVCPLRCVPCPCTNADADINISLVGIGLFLGRGCTLDEYDEDLQVVHFPLWIELRR